jgi:hypothetical protein
MWTAPAMRFQEMSLDAICLQASFGLSAKPRAERVTLPALYRRHGWSEATGAPARIVRHRGAAAFSSLSVSFLVRPEGRFCVPTCAGAMTPRAQAPSRLAGAVEAPALAHV